MKPASTKLVKFYKGVIIPQIQEKISSDGAFLSLEEVDTLLKNYADYDFKSTKEMTMEQLQELIEYSIQFAAEIGLSLDYPPDELDEKIKLNL